MHTHFHLYAYFKTRVKTLICVEVVLDEEGFSPFQNPLLDNDLLIGRRTQYNPPEKIPNTCQEIPFLVISGSATTIPDILFSNRGFPDTSKGSINVRSAGARMQRLTAQPNTFRAEPKELGVPSNQRHTAQAVAAHQLFAVWVTLLKCVQDPLKSDLRETREQHSLINGRKGHV